MNTTGIWEQGTLEPIVAALPNILGAVLILVVGWIAASILTSAFKRILRKTQMDNKLAAWAFPEDGAQSPAVESVLSQVVFYTLMLFVVVAALESLQLSQVTQPLNTLLNEVTGYIPQILGGLALFAIAWFVARIVKTLVLRVTSMLRLDARVRASADESTAVPLSKTLAETAYWLIFLLFLPIILDTLDLQGLLTPVENMFSQAFSYLPNLVGAIVIFFVGWFVARVVQRIVTNLLMSLGFDRFSAQLDLDKAIGEQSLSQLVGTITYVAILIPVLIASLNALQIEAITQPASQMLERMLVALPNVLAALLVIFIAYSVGRLVGEWAKAVLQNAGFDAILVKLGVSRKVPEDQNTPSEMVGYLITGVIILFATIEAFNLLGFEQVAALLGQFTMLVGNILLGLVVFAVGLYLANLASRAIHDSGTQNAGILAEAARIAIIILSGAMALRQMNLASDIINLGFTLVLGAVAVAVALAFGLGGRDTAGRLLDEWVERFKKRVN